MRASHHLACGLLRLEAGAPVAAVRAESAIPRKSCRGGIERGPQRLEHCLPFLPDVVDQRIIGDQLRVMCGNAFIDETLANIIVNRRVGRHALGKFRFLGAALAAVGKQVPGIARGHQPRAGQRQCDAAGIDGDPATSPLLGDVGCGARAASRIEHEVAGIRGHEVCIARLLFVSLNDIDVDLQTPS